MEHKQVQVSDVRNIDTVDGIAEAIVSVTNIVDSVNDIIVPGAYKATLKKRNPKGVWSHDTNIPVAKTLRVEELMPGDPRLPSDLVAKNAGALLVRMQFNLNTSRGRDAFGDVQFFGPEQEWSIGYAVGEGKSETGKDGIRRIKELELYEYSPVIFGAAPHTRTLNVKEGENATEEKEKDVFTGSPTGTPTNFGTPQRIGVTPRHPRKPKDAQKAKGLKVGDFVSWNSSGGTARGKIEYIMRTGTLGVPDSDFSIDATAEDPAVLIRVYKNTSDGWEETEVLVGHKMSTLQKIDSLKEFDEIEEFKAIPKDYSDLDFSIPSGVKKQAEIGLNWSKEFNRGGTSVGRNTANYLMSKTVADPDKVRHIAKYFPRHANEMSLPSNSKPSADGYPGNGLIAWKLWGGDEGRRWAEKLVTAMNYRDEKKDLPPIPMHAMEDDNEGYSSEYADAGLSDRQMELADSYCEIVDQYGQFDQSSGANGAHYAEKNPFASEGLKCSNCIFYEGGKACHIVTGTIDPNAICKLWIIKEEILNPEDSQDEPMMEDSGVKSLEVKGLVSPVHSTRVDDTSKWVDSVQFRRMRSPAPKSYYDKIFGVQLPNTDGDQKTHYSYVHHFVNADGTPGAASWPALMNTMALLNGARNGTRLRGEERKQMYNHYKRHYLDFGKKPPELKSDEELDNLMIKNGLIDKPLTPKEQQND